MSLDTSPPWNIWFSTINRTSMVVVRTYEVAKHLNAEFWNVDKATCILKVRKDLLFGKHKGTLWRFATYFANSSWFIVMGRQKFEWWLVNETSFSITIGSISYTLWSFGILKLTKLTSCSFSKYFVVFFVYFLATALNFLVCSLFRRPSFNYITDCNNIYYANYSIHISCKRLFGIVSVPIFRRLVIVMLVGLFLLIYFKY